MFLILFLALLICWCSFLGKMLGRITLRRYQPMRAPLQVNGSFENFSKTTEATDVNPFVELMNEDILINEEEYYEDEENQQMEIIELQTFECKYTGKTVDVWRGAVKTHHGRYWRVTGQESLQIYFIACRLHLLDGVIARSLEIKLLWIFRGYFGIIISSNWYYQGNFC